MYIIFFNLVGRTYNSLTGFVRLCHFGNKGRARDCFRNISEQGVGEQRFLVMEDEEDSVAGPLQRMCGVKCIDTLVYGVA